MNKHGFDKEHYYCVLAKVLVVIIITKHMDMLANYSQLMNEMTRLDIYKLLLSFPWRPGDLLCRCVYFAMMNVFVLQLMYVLMQSQVYSVMNTSGYKVCTEVEPLHSQPILPVLLLDTTNLDLDEVKEENMQVDQTASADTLTVLLTLLSQAEVFSQGESIFTVLLRLKSYPQEQPTLLVKGGALIATWLS